MTPAPRGAAPSGTGGGDWPDALVRRLDELAPAILSPEDLGFCHRAEDLLDAAARQAERWDRAARTRFRTARAQGYDQGREVGRAEVSAAVAAVLKTVERARRECDEAVHALVLSAMERFFAAAPFPALIRHSVTAALADLRIEGMPSIAAHPETRAAIEREFAEHGVSVQVAPAPQLRRDEVELVLQQGRVAISLGRHLETLRRVLADQPAGGGRGG